VIRSSLAKLAAVGALTVALTGCALLKSPPPVQTYRFGGAAPTAAAAQGVALTPLSLRRVQFPEATGSDRLLGVTGTETAYIKGARWVAPASDLYLESLENAFAGQATRVRLMGPRQPAGEGGTLIVDMRAFEARYDAPGAIPVIVVTANARILNGRDTRAERLFSVQQPATENRVSSIVEAFDIATRDLNTQIVSWTEQNAG